ncbi:tyrosine-type recombinase/integrase [Streptomyces sp. NPDC051020]|uniref:tyrosine-type recombinase/integrase n=1 Tax=Streptomyces sp. NPDC051020 TaxID=3155409 RepID=UPI00343C48BE
MHHHNRQRDISDPPRLRPTAPARFPAVRLITPCPPLRPDQAADWQRLGPGGSREPAPRFARHGCATLLTAAGAPPRVIMEILGHSRISITMDVYTMDVYTHVVHDTQREAISHMDRLLKRRLPVA